MTPRHRPTFQPDWHRLKRKWDADRSGRRSPVTICIAAVCEHEGELAVVLCADFQGTRGDYIKADDVHKLWYFYKRNGAILFAGDPDTGREFCRRYLLLEREFDALEKVKDDEDIRASEYLAKTKALVAKFRRERADDALRLKYSLGLDDLYAPNSATRFSSSLYGEMVELVKTTNIGAEFIIAYTGDLQPIILRVAQNGDAWIEGSNYAAIGTGAPLAMAIFSQFENDGEYHTLPECLTWVQQAKKTAESNPYVGKATSTGVLLKERAFKISEEAWDVLMETPGIPLVKVDQRLVKLG